MIRIDRTNPARGDQVGPLQSLSCRLLAEDRIVMWTRSFTLVGFPSIVESIGPEAAPSSW